MGLRKLFIVPVIGLSLGFWAAISQVHAAPDGISNEGLEAGADLVVSSVSGPTTATHNKLVSVTFRVKNQGTAASGSYKVGLYLSSDRSIAPAVDRLLDRVPFFKGLEPGESRKTTKKVLIPISGLSGSYYYGAVVAGSKKTSSTKVSLSRYSLEDDNNSVRDHKTGLIWQRADDGIQRNWEAAKQYCADSILGGKSTWRLPRSDELQTIVDYTRYNPSMDPVFAPPFTGSIFWSYSASVHFPDYAWTVLFNEGSTSWGKKTDGYSVRCVRGRP